MCKSISLHCYLYSQNYLPGCIKIAHPNTSTSGSRILHLVFDNSHSLLALASLTDGGCTIPWECTTGRFRTILLRKPILYQKLKTCLIYFLTAVRQKQFNVYRQDQISKCLLTCVYLLDFIIPVCPPAAQWHENIEPFTLTTFFFQCKFCIKFYKLKNKLQQFKQYH